jgi:threonylcarbamoyladenosine tRNA methylthiotransferase MtaB
MNPLGFHTITLGCKLNQFDTAAVEGELLRRGFQAEADVSRAGVVVVNTCTVTARADADARKRIRSVRRHNPDCTLLVTGCYAERDPGEIGGVDGVDHIFGNREKAQLAAVLDRLLGGTPDHGCDRENDGAPALHFGDRTRAFLKVQEGCRLACSYCIIPTVRGPSRSVRPDRVIATARSLFDSGYSEVVLTGVNVGDYGLDLDPRLTLAELLRELLRTCGPRRIRLNSLEPRTVTDEIVELMAGSPRLAPHLQVPLQSASDRILGEMRRNYRSASYLALLDRLREAVPHIGLGADVIVGFPGETDLEFDETRDFIAASPLNYLHVFSWSARPGTVAADLPDRVSPRVVRERSSALRALAEELSLSFRQGLVGTEQDAVVLGKRKTDSRIRALTGNFVELALEPGSAARGEMVRVRITRASRDETVGDVTRVPEWARPRANSAHSAAPNVS